LPKFASMKLTFSYKVTSFKETVDCLNYHHGIF